MSCFVSVIIPTKDRPGLLGQAVHSALQGLADNGELIVVDDHSKQPAIKNLAPIGDARLKIVDNTSVSGCSASRNFGASVAKGKLLFFLDDDDLMHPEYISYICKFHAANPEYDFGFSATQQVPFEINGIPESKFENASFSGQPVLGLPARKRLFGLGCGFWITRKAFIELGGLDEEILMGLS